MAIWKNVASQKIAVFAWDASAQSPKTGDAANITGEISKDGGTSAATNDVNPTELEATDHPGIYIFDMTQSETNANLIVLTANSSTANIEFDSVIIYTEIKPYTEATVSDAGATSTDFDTDLTEASDNHYNGTVMVFITGNLAGQARSIGTYTGASKNCNFTGNLWSEAPANGDAFVLVGRIE